MADLVGDNAGKSTRRVGAWRAAAGYFVMAASLLVTWTGDLYSIRDAFGGVMPIFGACSIGPLLVVGLLGPWRVRAWMCAVLIWVLSIANARWQHWMIEQRAVAAFEARVPQFQYMMYRFESSDLGQYEATYSCAECWYYVDVYTDDRGVQAVMKD